MLTIWEADFNSRVQAECVENGSILAEHQQECTQRETKCTSGFPRKLGKGVRLGKWFRS